MAKSGTGWWLIAAALASAGRAQPLAAQDDALIVALDEPINVKIDGTVLKIALHTGSFTHWRLLQPGPRLPQLTMVYPRTKSGRSTSRSVSDGGFGWSGSDGHW